MTKIGYKEIKNKGHYESETVWMEIEIYGTAKEEIFKASAELKENVRTILNKEPDWLKQFDKHEKKEKER